MITVIIPVYNSEKTISRTINSLLNQTEKNFNVIIIDDGSKDRTIEILNNIVKNDKRFAIYSQSNQGVSNARNQGINLVETPYLSFLDSDDIYLNNFIEEFYKIHSKNSLVDVIAFKNPNNKLTSNKLSTINYLKHKNTPDTNCWIIKKELLIKNNIYFDEDIFWGEDMLFFYKTLLYSKRKVYTNKIVTQTFNTEYSLSKKQVDNNKTKFIWLERILDISENDLEKRIIKSYLFKGTYLGLMINKNLTKEEYKSYLFKFDATNGLRSLIQHIKYIYYYNKF